MLSLRLIFLCVSVYFACWVSLGKLSLSINNVDILMTRLNSGLCMFVWYRICRNNDEVYNQESSKVSFPERCDDSVFDFI